MNLEHVCAGTHARALQAPTGKAAIFVELESLMPPLGGQRALELQFMLAPATATALRALHALGAAVFVVSYAQPADLGLQLLQRQGVLRQLSALGEAVCAGCYSWQDLPLAARAAAPTADREVLQPAAPCLLLRHICVQHGVAASRSWFIGASAQGVGHAARSGLQTIFLRERGAAQAPVTVRVPGAPSRKTVRTKAHFFARSLADAALRIGFEQHASIAVLRVLYRSASPDQGPRLRPTPAPRALRLAAPPPGTRPLHPTEPRHAA
jgi:hypothetical protein